MSDVTCCMNVDSRGMSEWTIAFVRIWRVRDTYYGFNEFGMFRLSGPADSLVPIACSVTTSPNDNNTENLKRVAYSRIECDGEADIELLLDGVSGGVIPMASEDKRAKFARGVKGRFVAFRVSSTDPQFYLHDIAAEIETLQRGYR